MKLYEDYLQTIKNLLNHFGYEYSWLNPNKGHYFDDCTHYFWCLSEDKKELYFATSLEELNNQDDDYYEEVYSAIYRAVDYSLIITIYNGDMVFNIFDNTKESKPEWL